MAESRIVASSTPPDMLEFLFVNETFYLANLTQQNSTLSPMVESLQFTPRPAASFFFGLVSLVGTVGNLLLILSFVLFSKMRCSLNAFITSMAVSDLVVSVIYDSLSAQALAVGGWIFRPELCRGLGVTTVVSGSHSLISSALIAVNRYILVTKASSVYKNVFSPSKTFAMIVIAWAMSFLTVAPAAFFGFGALGYNIATNTCDFLVNDPNTYLYFFTLPGTLVAVANFVCIFCYCRIFQTVKESAVRSQPNQQIRKAPTVPIKIVKETKQMFLIYITFLFTTAPYSVLYAADKGMDDIPSSAFVVAAILYACNSTLNPIIHTWRNRAYRNAFRVILCFAQRRKTHPQAIPV